MKTKQIRIRLSVKFINILKDRAARLELPLSQYIKFILIKEAESNIKIPSNSYGSTEKGINDEKAILTSFIQSQDQ